MQDPVASTADSPLRFRGRLNEADVDHIDRYHGTLIFYANHRWPASILLTLACGAFVWWVLWWDLGWESIIPV
jgi:hypothetical protein